ncbi:hypothetical protein [Mycolicibacter senuensis]|uniref:DUF3298 domain-containing protein n=1 Tax=Mycolicibacter senuensis TaxID=386913 RepID=A0A7I9XHA1_9MYCO|nr:hypothetical protein [Mycolicibacter senuensis]MDQ2626600.1 hypothetical protein [Actinomycetota bacterium]ORW65199.1 hypothetical protein AWC24_16225 [Mycolicibacter senuensis]GFG68717.1 hypothetical protein MSEN_04370 [Mycolicibacter senuensis]
MGSGQSAIRALASVTAVVTMLGLATACDSSTSDGPESATTATSASSATVRATPLTGFIEPDDGTRGTVTYQAELPQLRGGDAAVREMFNTEMRAALDRYLQPADDDTPVTVAPGILARDHRSEVSHIGTGAVAGVLVLNIYPDRAAHPYNVVATAVIDAHAARPLALTDLFTDPAAGLTAVVDGLKVEIADDELLAGQTPPQPVADQLADWVPAADGLVIYLPVAHVLGDYYPVTVGWDVLAGVLKPGMRETLTA